jgi:hypothetical protein
MIAYNTKKKAHRTRHKTARKNAIDISKNCQSLSPVGL